MYIDFLVEELSAEAALRNIVPKILDDVEFNIFSFQGKDDLLSKLPNRLKKYAYGFSYCYVVVLVDEDRQDCLELKAKMEAMSQQAGLVTKSNAGTDGKYQVINRILVEEIEAWFFGDVEAIREKYPRVSETLHNKKQYRNPDAIKGGTWEALERVLQQAGYFKNGLRKVEAAREISACMKPSQNLSKSFQLFRDSLLTLPQKGQ